MERKNQMRLTLYSKIAKALAHPSRLFIVEELLKGEQCVCKLSDMIGADISTVSRHLSILKNAGIIEYEKRGNQVFYRVCTPCVLNFFQCIEKVIESQAEEKINFYGK